MSKSEVNTNPSIVSSQEMWFDGNMLLSVTLFHVCHYLPKHYSLKYNFASFGFGPLCLDTCENWFWFWFVWHRSAACAPKLIHLTRSRRNSAFSSPLLPGRCLCIFFFTFLLGLHFFKTFESKFRFHTQIDELREFDFTWITIGFGLYKFFGFSSRNHCSQFFYFYQTYDSLESITA